MDQTATSEGYLPFRVPSVDAECRTYYKIFGDTSCGQPTVVVLHGGPGAGHEYLLPFAKLWTDYGTPVVFYDQIGCAGSTHLPQTAGNESIWQESLFITELENVLDRLSLRDGPGFHLLGHSWGGMFGATFAAQRPRGLKRLVLASALASKDLSVQSTRIHIADMEEKTRIAFEEAESTGDYESPAYMDGLNAYYAKHLCRDQPPPAELLPAFKNLAGDKTVFSTMNGPSSLTATGTLLGWTCIPALKQITAPTLVYNGEHDTSHDIAQIPFFELIPRVRWITFAGAGHMCHVEAANRKRVLETVGGFLKQSED